MFDYIPEGKKKTVMKELQLFFFSSGTKIPGSAQVWEFILNYCFKHKQTNKKEKMSGWDPWNSF